MPARSGLKVTNQWWASCRIYQSAEGAKWPVGGGLPVLYTSQQRAQSGRSGVGLLSYIPARRGRKVAGQGWAKRTTPDSLAGKTGLY